jgi:thiamine monophosphate kinase
LAGNFAGGHDSSFAESDQVAANIADIAAAGGHSGMIAPAEQLDEALEHVIRRLMKGVFWRSGQPVERMVAQVMHDTPDDEIRRTIQAVAKVHKLSAFALWRGFTARFPR